jgi:glyceraldehyde 3-phosphate dehydrogenase
MPEAKARVGLMGFGRIGRNAFRQLDEHPSIEVAAIVDTADPEALVYLLKYDTVFGRFHREVALGSSGTLEFGGRSIPMLQAKSPGDVNWDDLGVDIVLQATRKHRTAAECAKHLEAGADRVILASSPEDPTEIPTLLMGVNDEVVGPETRIVALGSNTANAVAPVLRLLNDAFGVEYALFTVVHAFTNEQRLADVPGTDLRQSRSAAENIIPAANNSSGIIELALPALKGRLCSMALNVPVPDGSNVDLVTILAKPTSATAVNELMAKAAQGNRVLSFTNEPIVSSDVIGSPYSGVFDGLATMVIDGTMVKSIVWFDNGWGYTARAVDLMERLAAFDGSGVSA